MARSNALGHMGLLFGLLGVIIMLVGVAQYAGPQYSYQGPLLWALIAWAIGLGFVIGERFESTRTP